MKRATIVQTVVTGALCAAVAYWANAGPLNPPAGPVSSTSPSLSTLLSSINALAGASDAPADTSTTPGASTDGRPLTIPTGAARRTFHLELAGIGTTQWDVAEFSESVDVIEFVSGGTNPETIMGVPGRIALPRIMLIRDLSSDTTINDWWELVESGAVGQARTSGVLIVRDTGGVEIARWDLYDCWPASYDYRGVDEQMAEQLQIIADAIDRVNP